SDGENLYSGNLFITPEMVQKEMKFQVKSLVPFSTDSLDSIAITTGKHESTISSTTSAPSNAASSGATTTASTSTQKDTESEKTGVNVIVPTESLAKQKVPKIFDIVWTSVLNDQISGKPAIKGEELYIPTLKGSIINMLDGKIKWTYRTGFVIFGHITVGNGIYAVSWDDTVYSINENGELNWKLKLDSDISQGPAWDGYYLYVVTDNGTVYTIKDNIKSAKIENTYKTAAYPVIPPSVSLAGKIFVVDGLGNLWKDKSVNSFIGKVRNMPILYENYLSAPELGFTLIDEVGIAYQFVPLDKETQIVKGKTAFRKINDLIVDAVLGKTRIYAVGSSGKIYVIDKESKKTLFSDTVPGAKYIGLSNNYLYVFGKEIRCYYVNDHPTGLWNSLYANQFNWNSAVK
ncbi:MAG: PQQ-binding-like beta-propeller repeat protein, partial [Fervidobacterium sp.]